RSRVGRGALTRLVTSRGSSRMIAAAKRSWAASERSGLRSRARPSQLTHNIAMTVTTAGGIHHNRISTATMMPRAGPDPVSNTPVRVRRVHHRAMSYPDAIYHGDAGEVSARFRPTGAPANVTYPNGTT